MWYQEISKETGRKMGIWGWHTHFFPGKEDDILRGRWSSPWYKVAANNSPLVTQENLLMEEITIVGAMIQVFERSRGKFLQIQKSWLITAKLYLYATEG